MNLEIIHTWKLRLIDSLPPRKIWYGVILWSVVLWGICCLKYYFVQTGGLDLGLYANAYWKVCHGEEFRTALISRPMLGEHISFILYSIIPLYCLAPHPLTLSLIQIGSLGLITIPVWMSLQTISSSYRWPVYCLMAIFLAPTAINVALYDFHEISLSPLWFGLATFFYLRKEYRKTLFCMIFILISKENLSLVLFFWGLVMVIFDKKFFWGMIVSLVSLGWFIFACFYWMPVLNQFQENHHLISRYGYLGTSHQEILSNLLTHPYWLITKPFTWGKLLALLGVLMPLAWVPVVPGRLKWVILADLAINYASISQAQFNVKYHYFVSTWSMLSICMVMDLSTFDALTKHKIPLKKWIVLNSCLGLFFSVDRIADAWPASNWRTVQEALRMIPKDVPVCASNKISSQLTDRSHLELCYYYEHKEVSPHVQYFILDPMVQTVLYNFVNVQPLGI